METLFELDTLKRIIPQFENVYCADMIGFSCQDLFSKHNRDTTARRVFKEIFSNQQQVVFTKFEDDKDPFNLGLPPRTEVKIPCKILQCQEYQITFGINIQDLSQEGSFFEINSAPLIRPDSSESLLKLGIKNKKLFVEGISSGLSKMELGSPQIEYQLISKQLQFRIDLLLSCGNEGYLRIYIDDGRSSKLVWSNSEKTLDKTFENASLRFGLCGKGMNEIYLSNFKVDRNTCNERIGVSIIEMTSPSLEKMQELDLSQFTKCIFYK